MIHRPLIYAIGPFWKDGTLKSIHLDPCVKALDLAPTHEHPVVLDNTTNPLT